MRTSTWNPILLRAIPMLLAVTTAATSLYVSAQDTSAAAADNNQPPVLGKVKRDGAHGYSQGSGSGFSFASSKSLAEEEMDEKLAEFRSDKDVVWLHYSAEASDPDGDEVQYVWSEVSPGEPAAIVEQDDSFVPSGQAARIRLCVPPSGPEVTLQVVAVDRRGARSKPRSVVVNAAGCASEAEWARLSWFAETREAANQGDADAQHALAYAHINGSGVFKNEQKGTELLRAHAEDGNIKAQASWAFVLYNGKYRVKRNREEGRKWYLVAAEQGHPHSQFVMGWLEEDLDAKGNWYRLAAEQGHVQAQFFLAKMLAEGTGMRTDLAHAKAWMQKSADGGDDRAKTWIENWELATTFDESGNRPPLLASVAYAGDERPTSFSYSADKMTYKDGKWTTEGGQSKVDTIIWRKFNVRAEDFDGESIRYLVTQTSPDTPRAAIGGEKGAFEYQASGSEVMFAACFPQVDDGEFTFQVVAEDKRGAKSEPETIALDAIRSDRCP